MGLPLNTEFYERYSVENDTDTPVYNSVSTSVTNHPRGGLIIELLCAKMLPHALRYLNVANYEKLIWMIYDGYLLFAALLYLTTILVSVFLLT
jgi:hypothetical protein